MKEKKGGFLPWPWNAVVYVLLALTLRLFAIPVILLLMSIRRQKNPHGVQEGYCLSRTRKRLTWLIWALLVLIVGAGLLVMLRVGLQLDRAYWETSDYVTLGVCGIGGPLLVLGGLYLACAAIRDAFFPERSALAKSIRSQLPYPEEAPPAAELFAMVDGDLEANGQWYGPVGIGREWVLGDSVNKIDRIRGIFVINELHQHQTKTGVRTSRNMELVLIDDRWQRASTTFRNLNELQAAADCLALRVPDARRGNGSQCSAFWTLDESEREDFERSFRQKQARRASEAVLREAEPSQDMILQAGEDRTSRVTGALVEEHFRRCRKGEEGEFTLTPTRPIPAGDEALSALRVEGLGDETFRLSARLAASSEPLAYVRELRALDAEAVLMAWLRREPPDLSGWDLRRAYVPREDGNFWGAP